jgi:hypothetical protein
MSNSSDDSTDSESLPLSKILADLDDKYPKLNFLQYEAILEQRGIVYAESVSDFQKDYFIDLGIAECAVGPFLKGVKKALLHEKREKKQIKTGDKENRIARMESVEI